MSITIAIDMMGGDAGPEVLIEGVAAAAASFPHAGFVLHGDASVLEDLLNDKPALAARCRVAHADAFVAMDDKPSEAARRADGTSMGAALRSVADGEAMTAVSCGNTGALMALSVLKLRRIEGVIRPAIAILWPSITPGKHAVVLDVGADIRSEARQLGQFAAMGASLAQIGLGVSWPRVALLNIGSEMHKGRPHLREASDLIKEAAIYQDFEYIGFVEANDIPMDVADVVVTDGFTGNIALKAAEGTARLIAERLKAGFKSSPLAGVGALLASGALRELKSSLDPRAGNGGIFLGLCGAVVKSHGSVDAVGFAAAVELALQISEDRLIERLSEALQMDPIA